MTAKKAVLERGEPWKNSYKDLLSFVKQLNVTTLSEWRKANLASLEHARSKKVQEKIEKELNLSKRQYIEWSRVSDKELLQMVKDSKIMSLNEWSESVRFRKSYRESLNRKIQRWIAHELGWKIESENPWSSRNDSEIKEFVKVKKIESLSHWRKVSPSCIEEARKRKIHRNILSQLGIKTSNEDWVSFSDEEIRDFVKEMKFTSLSEWAKGHPQSYDHARRQRKKHRWIAEELGWNMTVPCRSQKAKS